VTAALAAGALAALALVLVSPPRRRARRSVRPRTPPAWPRRRHRTDLDLGVVATEVATRLHAGAGVEEAWSRTLARAGLTTGDGGGPAVSGVPLALARLAGSGHRLGPGAEAALPATVAACRLTHEIGAPLAQVLERTAHGLTEAGQARAARAVALAGPRASARLLGVLPAAGVLMGAAVGADPVAFLLDGGAGTACLLAGAGLMVAGHRWVAALERSARHAGD
jgi:tight adherence protein B